MTFYSVDFDLSPEAEQELTNNKEKNQAWQDKVDRLQQARTEAEYAGVSLADLCLAGLCCMSCITPRTHRKVYFFAESPLPKGDKMLQSCGTWETWLMRVCTIASPFLLSFLLHIHMCIRPERVLNGMPDCQGAAVRRH